MKKANAFVGETVNVWCGVTHQPIAVATEIGDADVVTEDDEDVGFLVRGKRWAGDECQATTITAHIIVIANFL